MQEAIQPTTLSEAADALAAAAYRAETWAGEPFLYAGEDVEKALAPGTARRRALDDAIAEMDAGKARPSPPSDRVGKDDRRRRLRRRRPDAGRPHPHSPPPARHPVHKRLDDGGLRRPLHAGHRARQGAAAAGSAHDSDVRLVRPPRRLAQPRRLSTRDLRRSAHRARREDVCRDPLVPGAG